MMSVLGLVQVAILFMGLIVYIGILLSSDTRKENERRDY